MALNAFDTRSMIAVLDQREPPLTFFLNTFLQGTPQVHESENFDIDVRKAGRRVAPFVSPIREGKVMRREGFKTFNVKPGYLKPKRTITPAECQKRLPGENIFSPRSLQEREEIILARDLGELDNDCINREEVMLRDALLNGKIEIWEDVDGTLRKVREVDFLRNAAHAVTLEAGTWWNAETADVLGTLKTWCGLCRKNGGLSPNTLILAPNVVDTFIKDSTILSYLDNRRVQMGLINPKEIAKGVDYIAYLNAPGVYVEIYCDSRTYTDENGVEKQMMPDNTVLLGSTSAQVEMHYGPVQDLDAPAELGLSSGVIPARRFPKTWTEKDPSVRHVLLQSAPLPVPVNVDAFLKAIVLDPS